MRYLLVPFILLLSGCMTQSPFGEPVSYDDSLNRCLAIKTKYAHGQDLTPSQISYCERMARMEEQYTHGRYAGTGEPVAPGILLVMPL